MVNSFSPVKSLEILHFSDFHGALDVSSRSIGAATFTSVFASDRLKNPATFTLSSGDNIGAAPPLSTLLNEYPTITALNYMNLDVSTFGNHEHDKNLTFVQTVIDRSNFQWVVANYQRSPLFNVTRYTILNRGGVALGVVGGNTHTTQDTNLAFLKYSVNGQPRNLSIDFGVDGINQAIIDCKAAGAQLVVVLLHEGWDSSVDGSSTGGMFPLIAKIQGAAAVFGAHTHRSYQGMTATGQTMIVQTRNAGVEYTKNTFCFDTSSKQVIGKATVVVPKATAVKSIPDPTVAGFISLIKTELAPKLDAKIGKVVGSFGVGFT
jgi:5'-nucleotidase